MLTYYVKLASVGISATLVPFFPYLSDGDGTDFGGVAKW